MSRSPSNKGASAVGQTAPISGAHHLTRVRLGGTHFGGGRPLRGLIVAASLLAGSGLLVAACSSSASQSSAGPAGVPEPKSANAPAAGAPGEFGASGAGGTARSAPSKATNLTKLMPNRNIIYTANLTVRVPDVTAAATSATNDVTAVGGYIASEQQTQAIGPGNAGEVDLTLKIPAAAYSQTLNDLVRLGKHLVFNQQAQDVTQQVADVSSRVASAQAAIRQLRQLLSRAGDVGQLLSVQDEINSQESALESLIAQQNALAHETAYGTVYLTVLGHVTVVHHKKKHKKVSHGLIAGLTTGWHGLKILVVWLLTALGTLLPFAVPVAAIGAIVYYGRRRVTRRRTPPAAAPPAAPAATS